MKKLTTLLLSLAIMSASTQISYAQKNSTQLGHSKRENHTFRYAAEALVGAPAFAAALLELMKKDRITVTELKKIQQGVFTPNLYEARYDKYFGNPLDPSQTVTLSNRIACENQIRNLKGQLKKTTDKATIANLQEAINTEEISLAKVKKKLASERFTYFNPESKIYSLRETRYIRSGLKIEMDALKSRARGFKIAGVVGAILILDSARNMALLLDESDSEAAPEATWKIKNYP